MIDILDVVWLLLAGIGGGFIAGMLGIGGGIVYVLIFTIYLTNLTEVVIPGHILVKITIANSVFALVFAGLSGSYKQYKIGNFHPKLVFNIGLPGIIGAIAATYFLSLTEVYSKDEFALVFSIMLIPIILRMLYKKRSKIPGSVKINTHNPYIFALLGFVSGSATAISGLGGGFIIVPVLNGLLKYPIKKTVSISLGVIALVAIGLSLYNIFAFDYSFLKLPYTHGAVTFIMVLPVIAGVLVGAPFGVIASQKIPGYILRIIFVIFCISVIIKLLIGIL